MLKKNNYIYKILIISLGFVFIVNFGALKAEETAEESSGSGAEAETQIIQAPEESSSSGSEDAGVSGENTEAESNEASGEQSTEPDSAEAGASEAEDDGPAEEASESEAGESAPGENTEESGSGGQEAENASSDEEGLVKGEQDVSGETEEGAKESTGEPGDEPGYAQEENNNAGASEENTEASGQDQVNSGNTVIMGSGGQDLNPGETGLILDTGDEASGPEQKDSGENGGQSIGSGPSGDPHSVNTGFIRDMDIGRLAIIAGWQMRAPGEAGDNGADDDTAQGAQILPSGQYQVDKPVLNCVIAGDPLGINNINLINTSIYYPADIALSEGESNDGCGQLHSEIVLKQLEAEEAKKLFCNNLRTNNNNLPFWNQNQEDVYYGYEQVCGLEGYLESKEAGVYCAQTAFAYNDPAGMYRFESAAENKQGIKASFASEMRYLELTTFENDFKNIQYGAVKLNQLKTVSGDDVWGEGTLPSVRNTGNTRLAITIEQNDFGLGKSAGTWNIKYEARIGTGAKFTKFLPHKPVSLDDPLELGQTANIDFAVRINKFSVNDNAFLGNMTLSAESLPYFSCKSR